MLAWTRLGRFVTIAYDRDGERTFLILGYAGRGYEPTYFLLGAPGIAQEPTRLLAYQLVARAHQIWVDYSSSYEDKLTNLFRRHGWHYLGHASRYDEAKMLAVTLRQPKPKATANSTNTPS